MVYLVGDLLLCHLNFKILILKWKTNYHTISYASVQQYLKRHSVNVRTSQNSDKGASLSSVLTDL